MLLSRVNIKKKSVWPSVEYVPMYRVSSPEYGMYKEK